MTIDDSFFLFCKIESAYYGIDLFRFYTAFFKT